MCKYSHTSQGHVQGQDQYPRSFFTPVSQTVLPSLPVRGIFTLPYGAVCTKVRPAPTLARTAGGRACNSGSVHCTGNLAIALQFLGQVLKANSNNFCDVESITYGAYTRHVLQVKKKGWENYPLCIKKPLTLPLSQASPGRIPHTNMDPPQLDQQPPCISSAPPVLESRVVRMHTEAEPNLSLRHPGTSIVIRGYCT